MGGNPNHGYNNNNRPRLGNIINRVFESAGPDGKVRGTPQQIIEKYQALARDAQLAGDRVAAESFLQHAEHYSRMLGEAQQDVRPPFEREDGFRDDGRREDGFRDDGRREDAPRADGQPDQPRPRAESQPDQPRSRAEGQPDQPRPRGEGQPDQPRPSVEGQPDQSRPRGEGQPDQSRRRNEALPQHRPQRRPEPQPQPVIASSLTTIDPEEDGEFAGLIDTPESAAAVASDPDPAPMLNGGANGTIHPVAEAASPEEEAPRPAPKRGRPRRKAPRPEGEPADAAPGE